MYPNHVFYWHHFLFISRCRCCKFCLYKVKHLTRSAANMQRCMFFLCVKAYGITIATSVCKIQQKCQHLNGSYNRIIYTNESGYVKKHEWDISWNERTTHRLVRISKELFAIVSVCPRHFFPRFKWHCDSFMEHIFTSLSNKNFKCNSHENNDTFTLTELEYCVFKVYFLGCLPVIRHFCYKRLCYVTTSKFLTQFNGKLVFLCSYFHLTIQKATKLPWFWIWNTFKFDDFTFITGKYMTTDKVELPNLGVFYCVSHIQNYTFLLLFCWAFFLYSIVCGGFCSTISACIFLQI